MKGILMYSPTKQNWEVEYEEMNRKVRIEVQPNRIVHLNGVGIHLQDMDEVEFQIETTDVFPYQWAVPVVDSNVKTEVVPEKKTYKKYKLSLLLSGFYIDEEEIICDGYDTHSNGYWYFYEDNTNGGRRKMLGCYPIERTIIHKIETITVEI
jgi:hypothetical protein